MEKLGFEKNKRIYRKFGNKPVMVCYEGKTYKFRCQGEYHWGNYLEFLKKAKEIKDWDYESHTFEFDNIGIEKWLIDFTVRNNDDTIEYYEWKGMVQKSDIDKLKLLNRERPEVEVTYVFGSKPKISVHKMGLLERYCKRVITNGNTIAGRVPKSF